MSDGTQYVTRDGLLYDGGKRAADADWLAALRHCEAKCDVVIDAVLYAADYPDDVTSHETCDGCAPLRALLRRAASGT